MYFPTIRYHADGRVMHVQTAVELYELGAEWSDTPAPAEAIEEQQTDAESQQAFTPIRTTKKGRR